MLTLLFAAYSSAAVINHNISTGNLIIPGSSTNDYVVTGSTSSYYISAQFGYKGTITLKNCSFNFTSSSGTASPIRIVGKNGLSNADPSRTNVNLVLDGNNTIYNNGGGRACIQVDQGAQINISAIEPCDNSSGTLTVTQANEWGGAGIGSLNHMSNTAETTSTATLSNGYTGTTAGGNVVISSGTITTKGGHGAGIGGGFYTYYDGMIVIYGGIVNATAIFDAAGVGSGCPVGTGLVEEHAPNSAVVVLPPAVVSAQGAGDNPSGGVGYTLFPQLGLAGTNVRVYIGDPDKPAIKVSTVDHLPNANIYFDLSQDPDINRVVTATIPSSILNVNNVLLGKTDETGVFTTTGSLTNPTTFFTDAASTNPETAGSPYVPITKTMPSGGSVEFPLLGTKIGIGLKESTLLEYGYSSLDAQRAAAVVKITYDDPEPITDLKFDLASGESTAFSDLIFLASDSATVISAPNTLKKGDVFYIIVPAKMGLAPKLYSDVLRMSGIWKGESTGYIRQVISQIVADVQPVYICEGESYYFNGQFLTEAGVYSQVSSVSSACAVESSVITIRLIVDKPTYVKETASICSGEKYRWYGEVLTKGGTYEKRLKTSTGACDSIMELELTEYPSYMIDQEARICQGEKVRFANKDLTTTGNYFDTLQTINGCDSIIHLHLVVNPKYLFEEEVNTCSTEYEFHGRILDKTGIYYDSLKTAAGCDSIYKLTLHIYPTFYSEKTVSICDDKTYKFFGRELSETGVYYEEYISSHGCDSVYKLDLTVNKSYRFEESATICDYEKYKFQGKSLNKTGIYTDTIPTSCGCDSIYTLNLRVRKTTRDTIHASICLGDPYVFAGETLYEDGVYMDTVYDPDGDGCEMNILYLRTVASTVISTARVDDACADDKLYQIKYQYTGATPISYSLYYDKKARLMGFRDVLNAPFTNAIYDSIPQFVDKIYLRPDMYNVRVVFDNGACDPSQSVYDLSFMIKYPSWVIEQNWNDVVAVLNQDYNGGYTFKQYDWFVNNTIFEENTKSYLYAPQYLHAGDMVYAQLTRDDEDVAICTCPIVIRDMSSELKSEEPILISLSRSQHRLQIACKEQFTYSLYDVYGHLIMNAEGSGNENTYIDLQNLQKGIYVVRCTSGTAQKGYKFVW